MNKEKPYKEETKEEIAEFFQNPNFMHFIGMFGPLRPGVILCATKLEHYYYPPDGEINKDFMIRLWKWEEIIWMIMSVPKSDYDLVRNTSQECGLSIKHGIPQKITMEEIMEILAKREGKRISSKENIKMDESKSLLSKVEVLATDIVRDAKTSARRKVFPLPYNNRVFTFESIKGHPVYSNDPAKYKELANIEQKESARISAEFEMLRVNKKKPNDIK